MLDDLHVSCRFDSCLQRASDTEVEPFKGGWRLITDWRFVERSFTQGHLETPTFEMSFYHLQMDVFLFV